MPLSAGSQPTASEAGKRFQVNVSPRLLPYTRYLKNARGFFDASGGTVLSFCPFSPAIIREQFAVILYRYARQKGYDVSRSAPPSCPAWGYIDFLFAVGSLSADECTSSAVLVTLF